MPTPLPTGVYPQNRGGGGAFWAGRSVGPGTHGTWPACPGSVGGSKRKKISLYLYPLSLQPEIQCAPVGSLVKPGRGPHYLPPKSQRGGGVLELEPRAPGVHMLCCKKKKGSGDGVGMLRNACRVACCSVYMCRGLMCGLSTSWPREQHQTEHKPLLEDTPAFLKLPG